MQQHAPSSMDVLDMRNGNVRLVFSLPLLLLIRIPGYCCGHNPFPPTRADDGKDAEDHTFGLQKVVLSWLQPQPKRGTSPERMVRDR